MLGENSIEVTLVWEFSWRDVEGKGTGILISKNNYTCVCKIHVGNILRWLGFNFVQLQQLLIYLIGNMFLANYRPFDESHGQ